MNEKIWHSMMEKWIKDFESIEYLSSRILLDDDTNIQIKFNLLKDIIETFRSEVEE